MGLVQGTPTDGIAREVMAAAPDCAVLDDEHLAAGQSSFRLSCFTHDIDENFLSWRS